MGVAMILLQGNEGYIGLIYVNRSYIRASEHNRELNFPKTNSKQRKYVTRYS
jgi:hypothetical protein